MSRMGVGLSVALLPSTLWADYNETQSTRAIENNQYVMQSQLLVEEMESLEEETTTKALGEAIVDYAKQFLGYPYVYGGNDLYTGVDCSGLVQQVFKAFNINVPRTAKAQSQVGTMITYENVQKGDLLFFGTSSDNITHVGIYVGEGQMIHASTPSTGIIISPVNTFSYTPLQVIRRVVF